MRGTITGLIILAGALIYWAYFFGTFTGRIDAGQMPPTEYLLAIRWHSLIIFSLGVLGSFLAGYGTRRLTE